MIPLLRSNLNISQVSKINENLTFRLLVAEKENTQSQTMRGGLTLSQLYCVHETDLETQSNRSQKDLDCGRIEGEWVGVGLRAEEETL